MGKRVEKRMNMSRVVQQVSLVFLELQVGFLLMGSYSATCFFISWRQGSGVSCRLPPCPFAHCTFARHVVVNASRLGIPGVASRRRNEEKKSCVRLKQMSVVSVWFFHMITSHWSSDQE